MSIIGRMVRGRDCDDFRRMVKGEVVLTVVRRSNIGCKPFVLYLVISDEQGKVHYVQADHIDTKVLNRKKSSGTKSNSLLEKLDTLPSLFPKT